MPSLSEDKRVDNAAIISGYSARLAFAQSSVALNDGLKAGRCVSKARWFSSDEAARQCGLSNNGFVARLPAPVKEAGAWVSELITEALTHAGLDKHSLSGENVRVYLTGLGPRVDVIDYLAFYDHNDVEDVTLTRSVQNLHVANMSQDKLAHHVATAFDLKYLPPNLHCTSNSSLAAVHLGIQAIESGNVGVVMVVNCSLITTQDISFLTSQGMLGDGNVQPFGANGQGVLFAEGGCVMLLESARHRHARQMPDGVRLTSVYTQTSAGRSNDGAQLSANLLKVMNKALEQADICCGDLAAIIPHGNGSEASDKAEALALASFPGESTVPVLAYKGQIGYTSTGSGIVDLIIGHQALCQKTLISPVGNGPIRENVAPYVLLNQGQIPHNQRHLLKVGLGVDGSVIGVVMSENAAAS